jgi:predicted double-glycine peptidase
MAMINTDTETIQDLKQVLKDQNLASNSIRINARVG